MGDACRCLGSTIDRFLEITAVALQDLSDRVVLPNFGAFQWRIQDFPQGGGPNCIDLKEFGPQGGRQKCRSATAFSRKDAQKWKQFGPIVTASVLLHLNPMN